MWNVVMHYYLRVKGLVQQAVIDTNIPHVALFEPSNFETDENRFGLIDTIGQPMMKVFNYVIPYKYHSIHVQDLAHAMFRHVEQHFGGGGGGDGDQKQQQQVVTRLTYLDFMAFKEDPEKKTTSSEL